MTSARELIATASRRLNRPRVYTARWGLGRGLKQIGGIGLVLPAFLRRAEEDPRHAEREEAFLRGLGFDGATVYDVGAFQGILTMFFATRVGPSGAVIAFEPHPANYARLREHLKLNGIENVTTRNAAIGAETGELPLMLPSRQGGQASADPRVQTKLAAGNEDAELITVPVRSLDDEVRSGLPEPDFVKIDVEGLELDVLRGARETIASRKPALFVEMHGVDAEAKRENARRVVRLLDEYGYSLHHVQSDRPVDVSTAEYAMQGHLYCK